MVSSKWVRFASGVDPGKLRGDLSLPRAGGVTAAGPLTLRSLPTTAARGLQSGHVQLIGEGTQVPSDAFLNTRP